MARKWWRMLATVVLVGATSLGLVVSTSGTAQALDVRWGEADKAAARALINGFGKGGIKRAAPGVLARMLARCTGPQEVGCAAGVAAIATLGVVAYKTQDWWIPWLEDQFNNNPAGPETGGNFYYSSFSYEVTTRPGKYGDPPTVRVFATTDCGSICKPSSMQAQVTCMTKTGVIQTGSMAIDWSGTGGVYSGSPGWWGPNTGVMSGPNSGWNGAGAAFQGKPKSDPFAVCPDAWPIVQEVKIAHPISANGYWWTWGKSPANPGENVPSEVNCKRPDGTEYSKTRNEVSQEGNVALASCDPGDTMTGFTVGGIYNDLKETAGDKEKYPLCSNNACVYRVVVDGEACAIGVLGCEHWSHLAKTEPHRVECHYGPYVVNVANCYAMERTYEVSDDARRLTSKNSDGNPATWDPPQPSAPPAVIPKPKPVPSPVENPSPSPTPSPSTSSSPSESPTASPSPTPTPSPSPTAVPETPVNCTTAYALGAVQPVTARAVQYLAPLFDIATVGGFRSDADAQDHAEGLAADFMTDEGKAQGDQLARHAQEKAGNLGVQYIIWQQRIWNVDRASEGWRLMEDRGSPTANHMDHVHVSFKDVVPGFCVTDPGDPGGGGAGCFANEVSLSPGTWVIGPLKCLFIPTIPISRRTGEITAVIHAKGPGRLFDEIGVIVDSFNTGAGCKGPPMPFDLTEVTDVHVEMYPLDACAGAPMERPAGYVKALSTVYLTISGCFACARALSAGFGYDLKLGKSVIAGDPKP